MMMMMMSSETNEAPSASEAIPAMPARCGRCGYATVGLRGTTCPECAFDLTRIPYLRFADRLWLAALVRGTTLVWIGAIGLMVMAFGGRNGFRTMLRLVGIDVSSRVVGQVGVVLFLALALLGAWLLSRPDPALETGDPERHRRQQRMQMGIGAVGLLVFIRVIGDPSLHPILATALTISAITLGLFILSGLHGVVIELLRRSEHAEAKHLAEKPGARSRSWIGFMLLAIVIFGALSARGAGAATVASRIEQITSSIGVIALAFVCLHLVSGSKAIARELEQAPDRDTP
jgi:hypothetical protein